MNKDVFKIGAGISGVLLLISALFPGGVLFVQYLRARFFYASRTAASIGIIGGSDGPTAIYITNAGQTHQAAGIFAAVRLIVMAVSGIVFIYSVAAVKAKRKNKGE